MTTQQISFAELQDLPAQQQYRMRRLQVYNWGTFSGLHDINIAEQGFLFVGRSGSGKSTLLDALTSLLIPPQWQVFNAAAREGERNRRDRNLATYIRGAWGEQKDGDSGEIAAQFLRKGTTWSALALTFANKEGKIITLIQMFWLRGTASGSQDVKRHYMIAERPFEIASELNDFDLDVRALKHRLQDVEHFGTIFRPYGERFRRLMSIESDMALKLLHKTQSAKNLGDLNDFLREFMLDEPETFVAADRLISEFDELDAAHQEVVTSRKQVETLLPARTGHEKLEETRKNIVTDEHLLLSMDGYCGQLRLSLLESAIHESEVDEQGTAGLEKQQEEKLEDLKQHLESLQSQRRDKGGDRIEALEQNLKEAQTEREARQNRRGWFEAACRKLGWGVPDNAHYFSERISEARNIAENAQQHGEALVARRDDLRDQKKLAESEFTDVRREINALERQPSNIPAHMLELRQTMAQALGVSEADLPFAGELMQVKEEAAEWRGAIERVLHSFGLSLLVGDKHYAAVTKYVDETHLRGRLVYYRVGENKPSIVSNPALNSLLNKLELKETTLLTWLESELDRRFNYTCVDNLRDFRQEQRALTRQGQVRHGSDRHEKDDRFSIDDHRRWVLGFDNREKLSRYKQQAQELGLAISKLNQALEQVKQEQEQQTSALQAASEIINLEWKEVDEASSLDRIQALEQQLRSLREGNRELQALDERIRKQREIINEADKALSETRVKLLQLGKNLSTLRQQHQDLTLTLQSSILPDKHQRQILQEHFQSKGSLTLNNLDERRRSVERGINETLKTLREEENVCTRTIEKAFDNFARDWPHECADFDTTLASVNEFLTLLRRLEWDGLPQHEKRFFDMLKEQSTENLAALNTHLSQARKDINMRMELVNEGLADAEFNPGTYLQIEVNDRHLPAVKEFREQVTQVLKNAWQMDQAGAEQRFLVLRELVKKLGGEETEERRWRELVLDVRLHMEFIGKELDLQDQVIEIYRSGAGKSGGQREKLSTTCLAAALRYQLGGSDGGLPVYAPVVLDEAFGKADNEFTELVMRIFEKFGFQMIVATPLKSVMTLEPFIGGACFVEISERKRSATLPIEYDQAHQRLQLPESAHGKEVSA